MFPNGYNIPFNSYNVPMIRYSSIPRTGGLFSRLFGTSIANGARSFSWGNLLNNASKTLNVINQAVPLVKQVGPIYNNMKSMLKVASLFKDETDNTNRNTNNNTTNKTNNNIENTETQKENIIINNNYSNSPNFFI